MLITEILDLNHIVMCFHDILALEGTMTPLIATMIWVDYSLLIY